MEEKPTTLLFIKFRIDVRHLVAGDWSAKVLEEREVENYSMVCNKLRSSHFSGGKAASTKGQKSLRGSEDGYNLDMISVLYLPPADRPIRVTPDSASLI